MGRRATRTKRLPVVVSNSRLGVLVSDMAKTVGVRFQMPVSVTIHNEELTSELIRTHGCIFYCDAIGADDAYSFEKLCTECGLTYMRQRIKMFDALSSLSVKPQKWVDFNLLTELAHVTYYDDGGVYPCRVKEAFGHIIKHVQKDIRLNDRRIIYLTGRPADEYSETLQKAYTRVTSTMYMSTLEKEDMDKFLQSNIRFETIGAILAEYPKAALCEYSLLTLLGRSCARTFICSGETDCKIYGPSSARFRIKPYLAAENPLDLVLAFSEWVKNEWDMPGAADWIVRALELTLNEGCRTPAIYDGKRLDSFETFWRRVIFHINEPIRKRAKESKRTVYEYI